MYPRRLHSETRFSITFVLVFASAMVRVLRGESKEIVHERTRRNTTVRAHPCPFVDVGLSTCLLDVEARPPSGRGGLGTAAAAGRLGRAQRVEPSGQPAALARRRVLLDRVLRGVAVKLPC